MTRSYPQSKTKTINLPGMRESVDISLSLEPAAPYTGQIQKKTSSGEVRGPGKPITVAETKAEFPSGRDVVIGNYQGAVIAQSLWTC